MAKIYGNFQTDLKSLRYGSEKPYITKDIGQAPGSQLGREFQTRIDDTSRIVQMLASKPGFKYLANEALLKQIDVEKKIKNRGNKSIAGAILSQIGGTLLSTVKIIGSTVGQAAVNGTGTHFLKGFRTDTYLKPGANEKIPGAFASFFGAGGVEGAQYALEGKEVPTNVQTQFYEQGPNTSTAEILNPKTGKASSLSYSAKVLTEDTGTVNSNIVNNVPLPEGSGNRLAAYNATAGQTIRVTSSGSKTIETTSDIEGSISNFIPGEVGLTDTTLQFTSASTATNTYLSKKLSYKSLNGNITKESRVLLGDQGARRDADKPANNYWVTSSAAIDKINALAPQTARTAGESGKVDGETAGRDLIKFRFHIITPDQPETVLYFRAFLDAFADNYSGQWNPVKYLGRAEDFQIYGGFQRKISLSFKIAAATRSEMLPLYQKMVWLASATAPTYADGGQFMRGTLTKITVGDYVYELPGVLNSVNYTWNTDYPWEIAMTEPEGKGKDDFEQELPMVMDCSIDFTPIHQFTPTTGLRKYITTNLTENNKSGIPGIDTENTGIGVTATPPPAADTNKPYTPTGIPFTQDFGPQNSQIA